MTLKIILKQHIGVLKTSVTYLRLLTQSATYGTKYRVGQIAHETTRTDIDSRLLLAAVIVKLDFRNLKSTTISF